MSFSFAASLGITVGGVDEVVELLDIVEEPVLEDAVEDDELLDEDEELLCGGLEDDDELLLDTDELKELCGLDDDDEEELELDVLCGLDDDELELDVLCGLDDELELLCGRDDDELELIEDVEEELPGVEDPGVLDDAGASLIFFTRSLGL